VPDTPFEYHQLSDLLLMADLSAIDNNAGISHQRVPRLINVYFLNQNCRSKRKNCITSIFFGYLGATKEDYIRWIYRLCWNRHKQQHAKPVSRPCWDLGEKARLRWTSLAKTSLGHQVAAGAPQDHHR
jgi:hypothetical protein